MAKATYEKTSEYLAIKNWEKYQVAKDNWPWIKDWVDKDSDPDYSQLTMIQRYLLDGCCRLRQRMGQNLRNDPVYLLRALCVLPVERRYSSCAIAVLMLRGFLIPTNQQHGAEQERRGEEIKENNVLRSQDATNQDVKDVADISPLTSKPTKPRKHSGKGDKFPVEQQSDPRVRSVPPAGLEGRASQSAVWKDALTYVMTNVGPDGAGEDVGEFSAGR